MDRWVAWAVRPNLPNPPVYGLDEMRDDDRVQGHGFVSSTAAIWSAGCMIIFELLIVDLDIRSAILSPNQHSNHKNTIRNRITSHWRQKIGALINKSKIIWLELLFLRSCGYIGVYKCTHTHSVSLGTAELHYVLRSRSGYGACCICDIC